MRNKEQEFAWRKVIEACMEDVKNHFADIQQQRDLLHIPADLYRQIV